MNKWLIHGVLALASSHAIASSYVLDFSGNICGPTGTLACSGISTVSKYGDVPGVLTVGYRSTNDAGTANYHPGLDFNTNNLRGLIGAVTSPDLYGVAEITFKPATGLTVSLDGFSFGGSVYGTRSSKAWILDAQTGDVLWSVPSFTPGSTPITYTPSVSSASGLILRWGPDAYRVGIDNIHVTVSAVPEPSALWLFGAGLLTWGLRRRRA